MSGVSDNIKVVERRIQSAAERTGRNPASVVLICVSKTIEPGAIEEAVRAGATIFGESKVQEAKAKIPLVSGRAHWHMIGHLQSNKARDAVALFDVIHSVDSLRLAEELNKWAEQAGKTQAVMLEVNVSGESSKFGLKPEDLESTFTSVNRLPRVEARGLMTVAPFTEEAEAARPYFRRLRELRDGLGLTELSMGMSHDFEVAIEEGATMVRVGTAIFGERKAAGRAGRRGEAVEEDT
ncbi:MAG TPA: YggS family pyridoxal phosphate-dependent enzyme [Verrucomicrobiae bacterium]|nr:YggS family pyridoxal phosphate-dependent enzyme [Verrucomicrobiae bacterium]